MDFFTEFAESKEITRRAKAVVQIGVYGSFRPGNITLLRSMRKYLTENGYNALLSLDMQKLCPQPPGMDAEEYNYRISTIMTRVSQIHIVFLFREGEGEHNINLSAALELQMLEAQGARHVRIFFETGCFEQLSSPCRGLFKKQTGAWTGDFFERSAAYTDVKEFILPAGLSFCYNRLKTDAELGYASMEEFYHVVAQVCREVMTR